MDSIENKSAELIENKSAELRENISAQIQSINNFISWSDRYLHASRRLETYKKLIDQRRALKKCKFSLSSNPAIAAFGESQKGKSYVITSLLSYAGQPYTITDKDGNCYNFIEDINPPTNNTEATGVVTRFTYGLKVPDANYPIQLKLLRIPDILVILADTYYNDVQNRNYIDKVDINTYIKGIYNQYNGYPDVQFMIDEDDIFDIRDYLLKYMNDSTKALISSEYFDLLAVVIKKIQINDWPRVFSKLWCDNGSITDLFTRLLAGFAQLDFADVVYVPISAILNKNTTLMSSDCLKQLADKSIPVTGNSDIEIGTDVAYYTEGKQRIIQGFSKSMLSAMTAEAIYGIPEESVNEEKTFFTEDLDDDLIKDLRPKGWDKTITRSFLKDNDILDFPGARSRLILDESQVPIELCNQMFLRGKVSYLFNKYSDGKLINLLLFCHDHEQNGPAVMPPILKNWIKIYVGETPEDRQDSLSQSLISPLFIIATKFNIDLAKKASKSANDLAANRWTERFDKVLYKQVLMATSNSWFERWTPDNSFKNTYLLRDFKFSGDVGGDSSRLFHGYAETHTELSEYDKEFRTELKKSFLRDPIINKFFEDPELSWDSAATRNNDGSLLIIMKLSDAAEHIKKTRNYQYEREIVRIKSSVGALMAQYYHEDDETSLLQKKVSSYGAAIAEFDILCGQDNYFFGKMIQKLQIKENRVFDYFYNLMNGTKMVKAREVKVFDLILMRCGGKLSAENSFEQNLEILRREYHRSSAQECREFFEKTKKVNLNELFSYNQARRSNSAQMASGVIDLWIKTLSSPEQLKFFESHGCNTLVILDIVENMRAVISEIHLKEIIASLIAPFVDIYNVALRNLEMIADLTAQTINAFVTDFGYRYYSQTRINELKLLCKKNGLNFTFDYNAVSPIPVSDEEMSVIFDEDDDVSGNNNVSIFSPFSNYQKWIELLGISFISAFNIPDYDVEANQSLGEMLKAYQLISL